MAIYQRDRDFHQIFSEINVDIIPLRFVKNITCVLVDGTKVVLEESDFPADENDNLETMIKDLDFYDQLADIRIHIDYARVEHDVSLEVAKILSDRE